MKITIEIPNNTVKIAISTEEVLDTGERYETDLQQITLDRVISVKR